MNLAKKLYDLQQIDLDIQAQQEALDKINSQLRESEALLNARASLFALEKHMTEVTAQQKEMEWQTEELRSNIAQFDGKLYGGKVKNPKELVSLEQEAKFLKDRLIQKEDMLLELMADSEATQRNIKVGAEEMRKVEAEWQEEQETLRRRRGGVASALQCLIETRKALAGELDQQVLELYEILKSRKGQAVVRVEQGRCQGCRLNLSVSEQQRTRAGALVQCSSCGRILHLG